MAVILEGFPFSAGFCGPMIDVLLSPSISQHFRCSSRHVLVVHCKIDIWSEKKRASPHFHSLESFEEDVQSKSVAYEATGHTFLDQCKRFIGPGKFLCKDWQDNHEEGNHVSCS